MATVWRFRLLVSLLLAALVLSLAGPAAASTQPQPNVVPPPGATCWCDDSGAPLATVPYILDHYKVGFGGNSYTAYGWAQITGWAGGGPYYPTFNLSDRSPARVSGGPGASPAVSCPWWINFCYQGNPVWNYPKTWNWPELFAWEGSVAAGMYNNVIYPCMSGAAKGDIGYIGGRLLVKLATYMRLAGFAALKASPQGFAVAVVGGCLLTMLQW